LRSQRTAATGYRDGRSPALHGLFGRKPAHASCRNVVPAQQRLVLASCAHRARSRGECLQSRSATFVSARGGDLSCATSRSENSRSTDFGPEMSLSLFCSRPRQSSPRSSPRNVAHKAQGRPCGAPGSFFGPPLYLLLPPPPRPPFTLLPLRPSPRSSGGPALGPWLASA